MCSISESVLDPHAAEPRVGAIIRHSFAFSHGGRRGQWALVADDSVERFALHSHQVTDLIFFYGTLMSGFKRQGRAGIDLALAPVGHGWIQGALFDLGIYPAAIPALDGLVRGEVHRMLESDAVLDALDEIEGYRRGQPDASLYVRRETPVTLDDGRLATAWVYFYNAPLGGAQRIASGDYLEYLNVR